MKRIVWAAVAVIMVLGLFCGCTDGWEKLQTAQITKIKITDLVADTQVELDRDNEHFTAMLRLLEECQQSLVYSGECHPEDGHQHQLMVFTDEKVVVSIIVNADGSFCIEKSHYELEISGTKLGAYLYLVRRASTVNSTYMDRAEMISQPFVLAQAENWTYYSQQIVLDGARYTVLARESDLGDAQLVYEIREPYGDRMINTISYIEDSFALSDENVLYFSIYNKDSGRNRLLGFSVMTNTVVLLPEDPCSNLLILDNVGWLACGDAFFPIDLVSGEKVEENARTVSDLGGLPEIAGALFHDPKNVEAVRYVTLMEGQASGTIDIQIWQRETDSEPEIIYTYIYDLNSLALVEIE